MVNDSFPAGLATRLKQALPDWSAQARFQPELSFGRHRGPADLDARPAAVLIALFPRDGEWHIPLIVRPAHMLDHAGQISLPGGSIERGETGRQAALREYSEELGAPAEEVRVLGRLSGLYLFASNFCIEPWVGVLAEHPRWSPSKHEVDRVLEVPVRHLRDPANTSSFQRRQGEIVFSAPCFCFGSEHIWGATSMVLAELVAVAKGLPVERGRGETG
jgi:8-oxo-dGTP pyrophosphatase MutT (NUDIX family)